MNSCCGDENIYNSALSDVVSENFARIGNLFQLKSDFGVVLCASTIVITTFTIIIYRFLNKWRL